MKIVLMFFRLRRATRVALLWVGAAALGVASLAACSSDGAPDADGRLRVITAFYPLQYAAERVSGGHADITSLTQPGAEPHDVELRPKDVARLNDADLVVYLRGFQPALDDSIAQVAESDVLDVGAIPGVLDRGGTDDEHADHTHDTAGTDPHFWLDPLRLATVGDELAERLARLDPEHAAAYRRHAKELRDDLEALDDDYAAGLASCASRVLVTSHESFGYLARRYDLEQIGVEGLVPDQEPSPAQISEVARFVREHGVSTIYHETLVSPRIAETVAAETGARVAVLDPLEGLTPDSPGGDYLTVMRANLRTLRKGQSCR